MMTQDHNYHIEFYFILVHNNDRDKEFKSLSDSIAIKFFNLLIMYKMFVLIATRQLLFNCL